MKTHTSSCSGTMRQCAQVALLGLTSLMVSVGANAEIVSQTAPGTKVVIYVGGESHSNGYLIESGRSSPAAKESRSPVRQAVFHPDASSRSLQEMQDAGASQRNLARRDILLQELATEQQDLNAAQARHADTETLHRHELNIQALKREITNLH